MRCLLRHPSEERVKIKLAYPAARRTRVTRVEVDAIVFGDWAAYETPHAEDGSWSGSWSVGHVPSGLGLRHGLTREEAVHIAVRVAQFAPDMPRVTDRIALSKGFVWPPDSVGLIHAAIGEVLGGVEWYP